MSDAFDVIYTDENEGPGWGTWWDEADEEMGATVKYIRADLVPQLPEPDWSASGCPEWWAVDGDGEAHYYNNKPKIDKQICCWDSSRWTAKGSSIHIALDRINALPLGIDWRTTLRKRPEASDE